VIRAAGAGVSPGRARGPVVRLSSRSTAPVPDPVLALRIVAGELRALADRVGGESGDILMAQAAMADDPEVASAVTSAIADGLAPGEAVEAAFAPFRAALAGARGEYHRGRVDDIDEIVRRARARTEGHGPRERQPPVAGILVGETISPADTASVPPQELLGIVSGDGSGVSHAAIVARSLGIPAVVGAAGVTAELQAGEWIVIDGDSGLVERVPDGDRTAFTTRPTTQPGTLSPRTRDGHPVDLRANVGSLAEARAARAAGLRSSGLVRTEFLFAGRDRAPSVDVQAASYAALLDALPGELIFRALDAGADKPLPYLQQEPSANPALGTRGIRLLLKHPELLADQVRALCRAGAPERTKLMLPMISRARELKDARAVAREVFADEGVELSIGAMIEVPAAALTVDGLVPEADFFSVGTNDLVQYLFATDRTAAAGPDEAGEPALWRLLRALFGAAVDAGRSAGVCGELAARPEWAGALWALGATSLSVAPAQAAAVSAALATQDAAEWSARATSLMGDDA
jgi:phosphotransferase system enzyme I (PtsI)